MIIKDDLISSCYDKYILTKEGDDEKALWIVFNNNHYFMKTYDQKNVVRNQAEIESNNNVSVY